MVRTSDGCCVLGLKSTPQAVCFGLACAAIGALAASLSWGSLEMEVSLTPELASEAHPVSVERATGHDANCDSCCNQLGGCSECNVAQPCGHDHQCDDCAFCRARAKKAQEAANAPFVPLHERPDYCVEPPDILSVVVEPIGNKTLPADVQPLRDKCLVDPDGTINLSFWGELHVAGKSLAEIKQSIESLVDAAASELQVKVSVDTPNSHVYYVITEGNGTGDMVARYIATGCETAFDAIAAAGPINQMGKKQIWIARPTPDGGKDTVLPIKWRWGDATTMIAFNPAIQPGDRVFISTPPSWMAFVERARRLSRNREANRESANPWTKSQTQ